MPTNAKAFSKEIKTFAEKLVPQEFRLFQRKIALDLLTKIVIKTPVDLGTLRGNWQVDIDTLPEGELDVKDKGGGDTIQKGLAQLSELRGPGSITQTVFLANNLPYAVPIEDGHSRRASMGMVALSIQEIETAFKEE